jgi:hypothetical protein
MNFLDWLQITFSLVAALIGLYIAFARPSGRRVPATTRIGGVGVALLGLSYFVGGFEGPAVETQLFTIAEPLLAVVGLLVVLGALFSQARGRGGGRGAQENRRVQ